MSRQRLRAMGAGPFLLAAAISAFAGAPAAGSWHRTAFQDRSALGVDSLPLGAPSRIALEPPFVRDGARYDLLVVGPEPGRATLTSSAAAPSGRGLDGDRSRPAGAGVDGGLEIHALEGVEATADSLVQVRRAPGGPASVRWVRFRDALGHPATFELVLEAEGALRLQWLQVPPAFRLPGSRALEGNLATRVEIIDPITGSLDLTEEGFRPGPGDAVVIPPRGPTPEALALGCGQDENWCDVAQLRSIECTYGARNGITTRCSTTQTNYWEFDERLWCRSCPYTFYVVVECGTEMHLPFFDMEGVSLTITDIFTGVELELEAINQCAREPFQYCNTCLDINDPRAILIDQGNCEHPLVDCEPFLESSSRIEWGTPLRDTDGDTVGDSLPCGPPNEDYCPVGTTGSQPAHEKTVTDVVLKGKPGLCGVFRLDIVSGGNIWELFANCTGARQASFDIYTRCEDALAAFDPLPELVISDFSYTGTCPDIELEVEVTNIGCADASATPLDIEFEAAGQGPISADLGPIAVSGSVAASFPVSLVQTPQDATVTVDLEDSIFECSEDEAGGSTSCIPATGAQSLTRALCRCTNNARAELAEERVVSCGGVPVTVNGGGSTAAPCAGGSRLFRFLDNHGTVVRDWDVDPTFTVAPARCPSLVDYSMEVACDEEMQEECIDGAAFQVECAPEPRVEITPSDNDVCGGTAVTLDTGGGFVSYLWSTGETSAAIEVSPAVTTTYSVEAQTDKGCAAVADLEVRVLPNPIPPPLGATLRVARADPDIAIEFARIPPPTGDYQLLALRPGPCPSPPSPLPAPLVFRSAEILATGVQPPLLHAGGIGSCPDLVFYKVRGTSPCTATPGDLCDGFPAQVPCP